MSTKPKKRGRGRPELPADQRRTVGIRVRFSEAERDQLLEVAGDRGLSEWIRAAALRALKRKRRS